MVTRASADLETDRGKRRTRDSGEAEEITADSPELRYLVETVAGPILGPMSYAKVVEAVATGAVSPDDVIRLGGEGPGQRLSEIADLYRHVPASGKLEEVTRNVGSPKPPERMIEIGEVPAHGGIARALALSAMGRETGLWLCEQGEIRKEVFLNEGRPEFVTSNVAGELLGEFLVARSVISRGELEMALALLPRFEGRLGDTLNALGLVEPVELFQHIGAQVREKLLEIFTWDGGTASFYAGVSPPTNGFPLGLEPWELLDSGIARAARQEQTPLFDPESASFVVKKPPPMGLVRGLLPAAARRLLVLTARPRSVAVLETSMKESEGVDAEGTRRALRLLLALDAIVLRK
jgi:serine/threonine-protein kinase